MFTASAPFYDALYSGKDYQGEAARLVALVTRLCGPVRTLLDVGCATGTHLLHLSEHFGVEGVELDPRLADQARRRLPAIVITEADMCELDLGRRFDVVVCLYGTIAYVRSHARLRRAFARLAAHLHSGGCLVVQPWYRRADACPRMQVRHVDLGALQIARMSRTDCRGSQARLEVHYLVGHDGTIEHVHEQHLLGVFSDEDHLHAMRAAGLEGDLVRDALGPGCDCFVATARAGR